MYIKVERAVRPIEIFPLRERPHTSEKLGLEVGHPFDCMDVVTETRK